MLHPINDSRLNRVILRRWGRHTGRVTRVRGIFGRQSILFCMSSDTTSPREQWEQAFNASPTRDAEFTTLSGIPIDPVYGPEDGDFPGQYPYTRGPYASMYRSRLWTMRMFAGFGTAEDTNWRFKEIIKAVPASRLHSICRPFSDWIGRPNVAGKSADAVRRDSLSDMEDPTQTNLGEVTTSMTINSPAAVIFAMFIAQAEKAGVNRSTWRNAAKRHLEGYQAQKELCSHLASRCGSFVTPLISHRAKCPDGTRCRFRYHIRRPARLRSRNPHLRSQTVLHGLNSLCGRVRRRCVCTEIGFFFNAHIDFFEEIANIVPLAEFGLAG